MKANTNAQENSNTATETKPHCCPWWMQYLLISPIRQLLEPVKKLVSPYVTSGMTVVDPGCGFGYVSLALAQMVGSSGQVVSVDVQPQAIDRLKRRAQKAKLTDRIDARVCDSHHLKLEDYEGRVDLLTVIHTLHEFEDLPVFLEQAKLLLKPTGRMLIVEPPGHVKPEQFEAELQSCLAAGFDRLDLPRKNSRRMTALFTKSICGLS